MKRVTVIQYETEDGQKHDSQVAALEHEFLIALRALVQGDPLYPSTTGAVPQITTLSRILVRNAAAVRDVINKYTPKIKAARERENPAVVS